MSKQLLSAAVDANATAAEWDELLRSLDQDPEVKAEWSRIWEWRDARGDVKLAANPGFCAGVMAAIAAEEPASTKVVTLASRRPALPPRLRARSGWRTLVPVSAAAGVIAAVLVVGNFGDDGSTAGNVAVAELAASPVADGAANGAEALPVAGNAAADEAKAAILNAYLMEHSNSLADRSMGGTLANARFAVRAANYRPDSP